MPAMPISKEKFLLKAIKIHGDKYDYSELSYIGAKESIKIICKKHSYFYQRADHHINGHGCPSCKQDNMILNNDEFKNRAISVHGNKYIYDKVNYKHNKNKIIIVCQTHGDFLQTPAHHVGSRHGCPLCRESRGEKIIADYLDNINISYKRQKTWSGCRDKNLLPFDFYIQSLNTLIEYDGRQHFEPVEYFGGIKCLVSIQRHDNIKTKFCEDNNINLIRISYDENISAKLSHLSNIS